MDYGTVTSDNIIHALIQRRKMEINKYVKVMKLIEIEEHKANQANERSRVSFLQAKQKRRKEWWRMDHHFRESLRKDLEANVKLSKSVQSTTDIRANESSNLSISTSVNGNKFAEFNLPFIISNKYGISESSQFSPKNNTFVLSGETGEHMVKKSLNNSSNNNSMTSENKYTSNRKAPATPHNTPNINVVVKPAKSVLVHTTSQVPLAQIQSMNSDSPFADDKLG